MCGTAHRFDWETEIFKIAKRIRSRRARAYLGGKVSPVAVCVRVCVAICLGGYVCVCVYCSLLCGGSRVDFSIVFPRYGVGVI